jgi:hypothetical protein
MPRLSAPAHQFRHFSVDHDEDVFDDLEANRGEEPRSEATPPSSLNLLDLILLHRRDLPFVLDPWTL